MVSDNELSDVPKEFRDDATLEWAESVAVNPAYRGEASFAHFIDLKKRYVALLKRIAKIVKISDGFQLSLKEINVLLNTDARTDYLTGLSNRRDMIEKLDAEISTTHRYGDPFSLIIADIDLFKRINDEHGHEAGDRVLTAVSSCLRSILRLEDHCARWGGEEFLICLPRAALERALVVAEKLRTSVEELPIEYNKIRLRPTISLGVSEYEVGESVDDVIRAADSSLIQAKQDGRNLVRYRARNRRSA